MKRLGLFVCSLLFLLLLPQPAIAGVLQIISIGGVSKTNASNYTIWESSPTIVGSTLANVPVNIIIDGVLGSVTSDTRGNWSYTPGGLALGNHQGSVASGVDSLSFTIKVIIAPTLAPSQAAQPPPPQRLPVTAGPTTPLVAVIIAGSFLLLIGYRLKRI